MLKEILKMYKKKIIKLSTAWILKSIMIIIFIAFTIIMVEYAIPSKDINLIIKLGICYIIVNILRATKYEKNEDIETNPDVELDGSIIFKNVSIKLDENNSYKEIIEVSQNKILEEEEQ